MSALVADAAVASRLRVVHYHPRALAGDGGTTLAVRQWAAGAAEAGARVAVATAPGAGTLPGAVDAVVVEHAGRGRTRRPVGLARALVDADVLVLHSAWVGYNRLAATAARDAGVPYVLTPHGAYCPQVVARRRAAKRVWWTLVERRLLAGAAAVHVFYDEERAHLEALGYRGPSIVAPNPVTVPHGRRSTGGGGYVLWLGRFDPDHKGLDLLVRAVALLAPGERPALRLHGPDARGGRRAVADLVRSLGLEQWVTIGDPVHGEEKWSLLERADGFVYPSRYEPFGVAPVEAALLGLPVLATPYPLGRFLAARGAALIADAEPASLADGLRRLASPEAAAIGRRAGSVARAEFSPRRCAELWVSQLEALL